MNLYELHQRMTAHLFPAYSSEDERFLSLALCGEVGELADTDPVLRGSDAMREAIDELADCRVYLELLAKCFNIEGDRLRVIRLPYESNDVAYRKLCAKSGLLANLIKKRWRDGVDNSPECREKIVEIRAWIELIARNIGVEGNKLDAAVVSKLERVVEKHKARLAAAAPGNTLEDSEYGN